jgi:hypothetical protein
VVVAPYPFYLYCNFSGYTDVVIGIARFLRIKLPENFDRPFSSLNFLEFWSRWHMTLSNWLKTYVYYPLLMTLMRKFLSRTIEPFLGVILLAAWELLRAAALNVKRRGVPLVRSRYVRTVWDTGLALLLAAVLELLSLPAPDIVYKAF